VWADKTKVPASVGFGTGHEDKVSFNRRMKMKNGLAYSHPGPGNPDIVGYAGPIDPQVGVIAAWDLNGTLLGTIVNFACHATTSPGGISANWIQYLEQSIQGALQTRTPVVFLQGACGDITQVDNLSPYQRPGPEEWSKLVGGRVGAEAVKVILSMPKTKDVTLDAKQKVWPIKRRIPSPETVQKSLEIVEKGKNPLDPTEWTFAKEIVMLDALVKKEPACEVEVQAIQVGPVVCVSNPAEYFVENGLRIKKDSGFPMTFPTELANGCTGYVPTEEAFGPNGGGYETRLTYYSNLEVTAGTQMADVGIELSKQMTPDKMPEPLKSLPFAGKPWTYGAVPPQLK
jgi:neutral ceramidase